MPEMLAPRVAEDQDVVEEDEHEDTDEVLEGVIHEHLECHRCVGEAEGHHQEHEVVVVCPEDRLLIVRWLHANLVIPAAQVELGEEARAP
jgi:hypothetical protein